MRLQNQLHDEDGRFVERPTDGPIPTEWAQVQACFLDPEEKAVAVLVDAMNKATDQTLLDMNFVSLMKLVCEIHGTRLRELTEAHLILAQVDPTHPDSPRHRGQGLG